MKDKDVEKAIAFLKTSLQSLIDGNIGMDKLIITKSLRGHYKNPKQISHNVLAQRIGRRDPGNKPSVGDRIAFAFIENTNKKALQGEKIETPSFITQEGLNIDYAHYITNQIMKPVRQVFALVLEHISLFKKKKGHSLRRWKTQLSELRDKNPDNDVYARRLATLRDREVKALLFDEYLVKIKNKQSGNQSISEYFAAL